jgi:hypothetical protein
MPAALSQRLKWVLKPVPVTLFPRSVTCDLLRVGQIKCQVGRRRVTLRRFGLQAAHHHFLQPGGQLGLASLRGGVGSAHRRWRKPAVGLGLAKG